jgi:hypothetical protein
LSADEARALVAGVNEAIESEDDEEDDEAGILIDDVAFVIDKEPPPSAEAAVARAVATGYTPTSFDFEPAAMARLTSCRSTLLLRYYARIFEERPFVALQKRIFEHVGAAVIASAEGTVIQTLETVIAERTRQLGTLWTKTRPLGPRPEPPKKPIKTRPARAGEVEAVALHARLVGLIEGDDPFARDALKKALSATTDVVRAYAAVLMDDGATSDSGAAKALSIGVSEVAAARDELERLFREID